MTTTTRGETAVPPPRDEGAVDSVEPSFEELAKRVTTP